MPYKDLEVRKAFQKKYHETYVYKDPLAPPKDVHPRNITGYTFRGKTIVLVKQRGRPWKLNQSQQVTQTVFPNEKFLQAATLYAASGDPEIVARLTQVPVETIKIWIKQVPFKELLNEIREENDEKIDAKFCEIVDKALEGLSDRIEEGDSHYDSKRGELVKKPISARELSAITSNSIDKRQLLRGKPTSRTENVGEGKRLELLAAQFIKMAKGQPTKLIEGEFVEMPEDMIDLEKTGL